MLNCKELKLVAIIIPFCKIKGCFIMKRTISLILALVIAFSMTVSMVLISSAASNEKKAINSLLLGAREEYMGDVKSWTDEDVCNFIYGKLMLEDYDFSGNTAYNSKLGLEYDISSDGFWVFDLDTVQSITKDVLGRDFPTNVNGPLQVNGNKVLTSPSDGGTRDNFYVQDYTKKGNKITAVGCIIQQSINDVYFRGYFQAVVEVNSSSVYGYTLKSLTKIDGNQDFSKLIASASSELIESTSSHLATNAIDGNLKTAWVEAVNGVGKNEWIKLENNDGSPITVSAIEFALGYQRSEDHFVGNGAPTKVLIECDNGFKQTVELGGEYTDCVVLDQAVRAKWIKITILDARAGTMFEDTCISEISLLGIAKANNNNHTDTNNSVDIDNETDAEYDIDTDNETEEQLTEENDFEPSYDNDYESEDNSSMMIIIIILIAVVIIGATIAIVVVLVKKEK